MLLDDAHDLLRLGQAPCARRAAGKHPYSGRDDLDTARSEPPHILLRHGILPHDGIHRRSKEKRGTRREQRRRQHVVGNARRRLRKEICRGGRDEHHLGKGRQRDMRHVMLRRPPHGLCHGRIGDLTEGERRDEGGCRPRHDDAQLRPFLAQKARDLDRLKGGDPARHAENDAPSCERAHVRHSPCRGCS